MSDRDLSATTKRFEAWMKGAEDRFTKLERRALQGVVSVDGLDAGPTKVTATATDPLVLKGAADWTQAIEDLGVANAAVTRDELGAVQAISPAPFTQLFLGNGVNVPTGAVGAPLTWLATNVSSGPYNHADMFDTTQGALVTPVDGVWMLTAMAVWSPVADATLRELFVQISTDGGATWADIFPDARVNVGAGNPCYQSLSIETNASKSNRWRMRMVHTSATTPLVCTGVRFQQTFLRALSLVV